MIPKFRAWIKEEKCFADYIESIRYYSKEIDLCWGGVCESDCFDFEGIELMQSTGLKDKKGKEIFEGDIITNGQNVMCMKKHNTLGFYIEEKGKVEFIADCADLAEFEADVKEIEDFIEIIGNIYENPEYDQNFVGFRIKGE